MLAFTIQYGRRVYTFLPTIEYEGIDEKDWKGFCLALVWLDYSLDFHFGKEK